MVQKIPSFIRLVEPTSSTTQQVDNKVFAPSKWQSSLFAQNNPALLVFIEVENATEADFLNVLDRAKPRFVIDLRLVPRFDLGTINRKQVFSVFAQAKTKYFDITGSLGIKSSNDARFNPELLSHTLFELAFSKNNVLEGPIVFLVDSHQFNEDYIYKLTEQLAHDSTIGWEILLVPQNRNAPRPESNNKRNLIFISHANPQDNDFVLWLSSRLKSAGYEVWSDVTHLFGGEEFWETIEEAIREYSAKVIVVLSKIAQSKKGVLDEINCAVNVERSEGLEGFVIPIRLDDLPFEQVRANLARKNIIDFYSNWGTGLNHLLKLFEQQKLPRNEYKSDISEWYKNSIASNLQHKEETVTSNWLVLDALPNEIIFYDVNVAQDKLNSLAKSLSFPTFRYLRLIGAFTAINLTDAVYPQDVLKESCRISTIDFLKGRPARFPGLQRKEAQKLVSSLIRQAWDIFANNKGLSKATTSNGSNIWFVPKGLLDSDRASFTDLNSKVRKRNLVGWSEKRQIHWHYGIELKPVIGHLSHMSVRTHIMFTKDGKTLLDSKDKMHLLRRRFCKSWWNDRWRDLFLAFVSWLAENKDFIEIHTDAVSSIKIAAHPLILTSMVSLQEDITDEVLDELPIEEADDDGEDLQFSNDDPIELEESL